MNKLTTHERRYAHSSLRMALKGPSIDKNLTNQCFTYQGSTTRGGNCPCYDAPDETDGVGVTEAEEHAYALSDIGTAS